MGLLLQPSASLAQLGALGGVSGIEEGGKIVGPLYTLSGEVGAADAGTIGVYTFYTQATRSFGKSLDEVYTGKPRQRVSFIALFINYNPSDIFQFTAIIPYERSDVEYQSSSGQYVRSSVTGIANPAIRGKFQFLGKPHMSVSVTVLPPTGYSDVGTETMDIRTGIALTQKINKIRLDAEGGYQFSGIWTRGPAPNNNYYANAALGWDPGERIYVFGEANFTDFGHLAVTETVSDGTNTRQIIRESDQMRVDIVPGVRLKLKDKIFTTVATKISVYNTVYRGYSFFYSLGFDFAF